MKTSYLYFLILFTVIFAFGFHDAMCENIPTSDNHLKPSIKQPFVIPAILIDGKKAGELILGQTTLKQALTIMPPYPGYDPRPNAFTVDQIKELEKLGKVGIVLKNSNKGYNPANASYILIFDKKDKLVIVQRDFIIKIKEDKDIIDNIYGKYKGLLREVYRDARNIRMQSEIEPCITIEIFMEIGRRDGSINPSGVGYVYTCQELD